MAEPAQEPVAPSETQVSPAYYKADQIPGSPVPPPPPAPGPLEQAANALGQQVAPLMDRAPEPVQNLADIVGQPVGGAIGAAQDVADQTTVAGMAGAALGALSGPQQRMKEQAGERAAQGLPANPATPENVAQQGILSPLLQPLAQTGIGQAIGTILSAPLPGTGSLPPPPTAVGGVAAGPDPGQAMAVQPATVLGTGFDDWVKANPELVRQAHEAGGGAAVVDAYVKQLTHAAPGAAPPEFVNPFDNTTGTTLERAAQAASNLPQAIGGVVSSGKQGTLGPFIEEQAIQTAMDPATLIPGELTGHLVESAGEHIRGLPGVRTILKPAAGEAERLAGEQAVSGMGEMVNAARRQGEFESTYGTEGGITPADTTPQAPAPGTADETIVQQMGVGGEDTYRLVGPKRGLSYPTLEEAVANHPTARVLPTRSDMVQQFETSLPDIIEPDGRIDPLNEQRLRDGISSQNPDAFGPQEAAAIRRRQGVRAAYDATPLDYQRTVEARLGTDTHMYHGLTMSEDAVRVANEPARGSLVFRDRWHPEDMTLGEATEKMTHDANVWLDGFDAMGVQTERAATSRPWKALNERLNPLGDAPIRELKASGDALDAHVTGILKDAIARGLPEAERTAIGKMFDTYTHVYRTAQLFNITNIPRYFIQNLTNAVNIAVKGGGLAPTLDFLTNIPEAARAWGKQLDRSSTIIDALEARTGQSRPNLSMTQRPYLDRIGGKLPKALEIPLRVISPEALRAFGSIPDLRAREAVGANAIFKGFKDLNARMPEIIYERARAVSPSLMPTAEKIRRTFSDFTDQFHTLDDPRTGEVRTGLLGQPETHEPTWHPEELRPYLREHLFEDMPQKPNPGQMNRIVNDILGPSRNEVRAIWDNAVGAADSALFPWRNTKGDALLGQLTLYHYYMTRQGGFYVSEMMKRPWVAAAYGRALTEMQQQNEDLGGPGWLTGFFQFTQSVGGFTTFFSPIDGAQTLLTFADWMTDPNDPNRFEDLTKVGQAVKAIPFFIHPLILTAAQQVGLLGPDARPTDPTGLGTFGVNAINLLNLANAQDAPFMAPLNRMGIGVDAQGNKIPLAPRPVQDLMARTGNAISSALAPITGLSPDEVTPSWATETRDIQTIGYQEIRQQHPEWNDGSKDGEAQIQGLVTAIMADPGNPEYQRWYGMASQEPYQLGAGVPQPLAGLLRIASPIQVKSMPEQRALDTMAGLLPSGAIPVRGAPDPQDPQAADIFDEGKYGLSKTVEGRLLAERVNEYGTIGDPAVQEANTVIGQMIYGNLPAGSITIDGQTYTNDDLVGMDYDTRQAKINAYLSEQGLTQQDLDTLKSDREQYLAAHTDVAAYNIYRGLIGQQEGADTAAKAKAFTEQMRQTNPGFAQYYQSQMIDHTTGKVSYGMAWGADAFLAATGSRPSVYSPTVGNEPSTAPGGYPSIPGVEPGQPIVPTAGLVYDDTATNPTPVYQGKGDISAPPSKKPDPIGTLSPNLPIQVMGAPQPSSSNEKYAVMVVPVAQGGKLIGWVQADMLTNTSAQKPIGAGTVPAPGGGLVAQAGQALNALGGAKDALGQAIGSAAPTLPPPGLGASAATAPVPSPTPTAAPTAAPTPGAPQASAGNPLDALGGAVSSVGDVIGSIAGHNNGPPVDPSTPAKAAAPGEPEVVPGKVVLEPGLDGIGIQADPAPTDETWVEDMMGGHAKVMVPYKGNAPAGVDYSYQNGHGAQMVPCPDGSGSMCFVHAAMDISCDDPNGNCAGTPVSSPIAGTVLCAGYGVGQTGLADRTCDFAKGTTNPNNDGSPAAHTVVLDVGADPDGNQIYLTFNHMGTANLKPGQQITVGDAIGTMGNTDGGPHTHLEAWGASPVLGQTRILDPHLVVSGYYQTHSVDEGA